MGEGEEIVGIAGHLDIVPVGGDWTYDPFKLTREGDYIYGRGTTDDKGPVIEALYAMKLLRDSGVKLNKRVRLIMGCNEETGSKCMEHYNEVEEELSCGFTPDANFPCIHGEKGHMSMVAYSKNTKIISMNGGFVSNAVCDACTTVIPAEAGLKEKLEEILAKTKLQEYQVTEENGTIRIYAKGVPAHASTPTLGVNAAGVTFESLEKAGFEDDFVKFYNSHIGTSCDGSGIGLKFEDEYGDLTLCNGIVKTENGVVSCTIDIRVPVTLKAEDVRKMCEEKLEDENGRIEILEIGDPLFFPRESPLVNALYKAYVDVTGDTENEPMVIGGGTYAKSLKNIIAFGPEKLGIDYEMKIISAHREPDIFFQWAKEAEGKGIKVIIAGAGKAAHLPGMCAALFPLPVIGIPMKTSDLGGVDSLYSIVQMPSGIPVATVAINGGKNAGILAAKILAASDPELLEKLKAYSEKMKTEVESKAEKLDKIGYKEYLASMKK